MLQKESLQLDIKEFSLYLMRGGTSLQRYKANKRKKN